MTQATLLTEATALSTALAKLVTDIGALPPVVPPPASGLSAANRTKLNALELAVQSANMAQVSGMQLNFTNSAPQRAAVLLALSKLSAFIGSL